MLVGFFNMNSEKNREDRASQVVLVIPLLCGLSHCDIDAGQWGGAATTWENADQPGDVPVTVLCGLVAACGLTTSSRQWRLLTFNIAMGAGEFSLEGAVSRDVEARSALREKWLCYWFFSNNAESAGRSRIQVHFFSIISLLCRISQ